MKLTDEQRQLINDNHNLIYAILNERKLKIDDWYDVAALGMCDAALHWDSSREIPFHCYAGTCIKMRLNNEMEHMNRQKRSGQRSLLYYNAWEGTEKSDEKFIDNLISYQSVEDEVIGKLTYEDIASNLNNKKSNIFRLLIEGYKLREIGAMLGISYNAVFLHKKSIAQMIEDKALLKEVV